MKSRSFPPGQMSTYGRDGRQEQEGRSIKPARENSAGALKNKISKAKNGSKHHHRLVPAKKKAPRAYVSCWLDCPGWECWRWRIVWVNQSGCISSKLGTGQPALVVAAI